MESHPGCSISARARREWTEAKFSRQGHFNVSTVLRAATLIYLRGGQEMESGDIISAIYLRPTKPAVQGSKKCGTLFFQAFDTVPLPGAVLPFLCGDDRSSADKTMHMPLS